MKAELVEQASKIIPEPQMLLPLQAADGPPITRERLRLVPTTPHMGNANIALTEIIEGKLVYPTESGSLQEDNQ